jgi:hypothetical protein
MFGRSSRVLGGYVREQLVALLAWQRDAKQCGRQPRER